MAIVLDLDRIRGRLFGDQRVRDRLARDYAFEPRGGDPGTLAGAVLAGLDQPSHPDPLTVDVTDRAVFRAAVRAIGSNSRSWATFRRHEPTLTTLLHDFDPSRAGAALARDPTLEGRLRECLPGVTSSADARAIRRWVALLSESPDFYALVRAMARTLRELDLARHGQATTTEELMICLAALLAAPPRRWPGDQRAATSRHVPKLPGMGYALAAEFLRNLGWSGFKPDRHITRLLARWFPDHPALMSPRVAQLADLVGRRGSAIMRFVRYSLLGAAVTPPGVRLSEADHLVWLLGSYVERKGHETGDRYWVMR